MRIPRRVYRVIEGMHPFHRLYLRRSAGHDISWLALKCEPRRARRLGAGVRISGSALQMRRGLIAASMQNKLSSSPDST